MHAESDLTLITNIVQAYFMGTYEGKEDLLRMAFHSDAHVSGNINGQYHDWTLNDFISRVTCIPTASSKGEKYDKEILSIDISNEAALAKARVRVNGLTFIDYITLLKIDGRWIIRNKSFTTLTS